MPPFDPPARGAAAIRIAAGRPILGAAMARPECAAPAHATGGRLRRTGGACAWPIRYTERIQSLRAAGLIHYTPLEYE
jgi:hypothetical protein